MSEIFYSFSSLPLFGVLVFWILAHIGELVVFHYFSLCFSNNIWCCCIFNFKFQLFLADNKLRLTDHKHTRRWDQTPFSDLSGYCQLKNIFWQFRTCVRVLFNLAAKEKAFICSKDSLLEDSFKGKYLIIVKLYKKKDILYKMKNTCLKNLSQ